MFNTIFTRTRLFIVSHMVIAAILALLVVGGGYWEYKRLTNTSGETRYVLGTVQRQTIISTVTGSGQVSSENRVDIHPKTSGDITSIPVKDGSVVTTGQAVAYLDASDDQKAVRDAQANLVSAQIALQKLQQPADTLTLTQAQNASDSAKGSLADAYETSFNNVSDTFLDLPTVMTGLNSLLYSYDRTLGGSSQQNLDYYANAIAQYDTTGKGTAYRDDAATKYTAAKSMYDTVFSEYKTTSRTADTATIEKLLNDTYSMTKLVSDAVKSANNLIQLYQDEVTAHNLTPVPTSNTQITSLGNYTGTVDSHLSSLLSSVNSLRSDKQNVVETAQSLEKTQSGADPLDIQSAQLTVTQRQNALDDAKQTLADSVVRAPFSGTIGNITAQIGDSVTSGTAIAAIVGTQQIAQLSLNEVDTAKVKSGQKATLTFDAIDGLTIAGTVADVNPIGAVSQGVVSYTVKIAFDALDPRVKAGMTVNAAIQTDVHQDVLAVPSSAVKTLNGQATVQVFNPALADTGGTNGVISTMAPQSVPVTVGISDDTNTEIVSGITENEQIVTRTIIGTAATAAATTARTTTGGAAGNRGFGGGGGVIRLGG